jgi:hypothetical protein
VFVKFAVRIGVLRTLELVAKISMCSRRATIHSNEEYDKSTNDAADMLLRHSSDFCYLEYLTCANVAYRSCSGLGIKDTRK